MTTNPLAWVDEDYDVDYASDGISRFGSYVRQRAHLFVDDWEPLSAASFAATVWSVATSPVMSPGYVRIRPDVWSLTCFPGEEPGFLLAELEVRVPWPAALRGGQELDGWFSWQRTTSWAHEETMYLEPVGDRRSLLVTSVLRVPIDEGILPTPCRFAALDVSTAKRAISVICTEVNATAGPVVARLRATAPIGAQR
jgi:hypothetical protein